MTGRTDHPDDALQELVSGRLTGAERVEVDAHLARCAECRDLLVNLEGAKAALRAAPAEPVPEAIRARILAALDAEDRMGVPRSEPAGRRQRWGLRFFALLVPGAGVVGLALALALGWRPLQAPPLVKETAVELRKYQRGESPLSLATQEASEVDAFFARAGLPFTPRVSPTRGASCRLKGACVRGAGERPRALVAYEDERGRSLLCSTFTGDVRALARGSRTFERGGRTYYVHEVDGVTLVCWQEGAMTNLLASDMPRDALLAVAEAEGKA